MQDQVTKSIIVKGQVETIFDLWPDFENFPNFMEPIKSIEKTGETTTHWTVDAGFGRNYKGEKNDQFLLH